MKRRLLVPLAIVALLILPAASAGPLDAPNDAGSGRDAGDSRDAAMLVSAPGDYAGHLPLLDTGDWYAFDVTAPSEVCINWGATEGFGLSVSVYGPNAQYIGGTRCAPNDSTSASFVAAPGRYFAGFFNYYGWAGYQFSIGVTPLPENVTLPSPEVPPPPAPTLVRIEPARGAPGTPFVLRGDHFQPGAKAIFGGVHVPLEVTFSPTQRASGVVPQLAPGTYGVTLVNPDGLASTLAAAFEVTLLADPGFRAGDLVIERRPVQVEGQPATSTAFDMRRVTVTLRNLGFGPTTEPLQVTVVVEPDGRMLPVGVNTRTLGTRFVNPGVPAGEALTMTFAWDTKGFLGDYVVKARISPSLPQASAFNDEVAVEHTVAVSGLGGL